MNARANIGFPATVVKVINKFRVVINRGDLAGVKEGQRFQIYHQSANEIVDPETRESLGRLEMVVGTGKVIQVQEKMSVIESDMTHTPLSLDDLSKLIRREPRKPSIPVRKEFRDPEVGAKAKPI